MIKPTVILLALLAALLQFPAAVSADGWQQPVYAVRGDNCLGANWSWDIGTAHWVCPTVSTSIGPSNLPAGGEIVIKETVLPGYLCYIMIPTNGVEAECVVQDRPA